MTLRHSLAFLDTQTGQLVEAGKHEQLLEKNGIYTALWRVQSGVR
ncbi:hypothetical protein RIVM261_044180 [Rivularia sp. IAM M-261]|nr:hypothetical protein RIVM261_044180 [Rivularia sp. IAM M-261]